MSLPGHVDVLIAGGGHAALCAAISARQAGAGVLVLERAPRAMRGGNSRHTRNLRVAHDGPLAALTGDYPVREYEADLLRVTGGQIDLALARQMIEQSPALVAFLADQGVRFQASLTGTLNLERTNAFFLGGGCALLNTLYRRAEAMGVQIAYDVRVVDMQMQQDTFTAAIVEQAGTTCRVEATAAVAACGGFQANQPWMREIWGPPADNFLIRGTPYNEGDVLRRLMDRGACTWGDPRQCHAVAIDARAPRYDGGIVSRLDCVCFSVVVNRQGERFYDEGEDFWPRRYAIWGRLVAEQPDQIAYALVDDKVRDCFMPSVFPPLQADSLPALARLIEVPEAILVDTVNTFNAAVSPGHFDPARLDDCSTQGLAIDKTHWAQAIDSPPYAAYPMRPGITFTYLGLAVDHTARVLMHDRTPAPNLFAAGEIMAGNILGQGYCAGTGMTIGGVFGRIAGREAACLI